MPKQLNVDLRFNADTSSAKRQIQDLQQSLSKLGAGSAKSLGFDQMNSEIAQATNQVNVLKAQLDRAFNVNTGKLDLTKFTQDMQKSGMSLEKYRDALMQLGPEGTQAFAQLATAISQADIPLRRTNKLLTEMGTVLKNTIKWQISSSAIHGFMGAIQQAYGYAQDLNESLTNIRIVTGQSSEQMAQFAERANRAAQSLSTTTTAYTDAALIFYQQGLDDKAVEERTNATIKMAQATGDSATEVSSYMTAIWNNFDDGSQSLEHYADVITALGAATASSSSEISEGLSKFASIADTVGLSYEYATSALATVVAQTRQSADVVGTAFKTIFARIQDLEQGATLEDGVDLGQYAKSLAKVGVDVLDANGKLREMDSILDDIGQRWGELDEAQRVALAQNVAGQRQYAQFMAIFENWDTFQENLSVANTSDGTLQKQADTYAESWEASQKRVKAAMEGIYQSIIDDDFFIDLNDGLAIVINGVNNLIKAFGGLPGVLSMISAIMLRTFSAQAAEGIRNIATSIQLIFGGREKIQAQQKTGLALAKDAFVDDSISAEVYQNKITLQEKYLQNAEQLNDLERKAVELGIQQVDILGQQAIEAEKVTKETEEELEAIVKQQNLDVASKFTGIQQRGKRRGIIDQLTQGRLDYNNAVEAYNASTNGMKMSDFIKLDSFTRDSSINGNNLKQTQEQVKALGEQLNLTGKYKEHFDKALKTSSVNNFQKELKSALSGINNDVDKARSNLVEADVHLRKIFSIIYEGDLDKVEEAMNKWTAATDKNTDAQKRQEEALKAQQERIKALNQYMQNASGNQIDWAQRIVNGAQAMMQVSMTINQIKGIINTIQDENMSGLDKALSIMVSLGMVIPMLVNSYRNLTIMQQAAKISQLDLNLAEADSITLLSAQQGQLGLLNAAKMLGITVTENMTVAELKEAIAAKTQEKSHWGIVKALVAQKVATLAAYWPLLLLVGIIAVIVISFKVYNDILEKNTIDSKEASQAANELGENVKRVRKEYENLKSSIEDYSDAKEALDSLVQGTTDWTEALINANSKALELIQNLHLIRGDQWEIGENGVIEIFPEALESGINDQLIQIQQAQLASTAANADAAQVQINERISEFANEIGSRFGGELTQPSDLHPKGNNLYYAQEGDGTPESIIENLVNDAIDAYESGDTYLSSIDQHWTMPYAEEDGLSEELRQELITFIQDIHEANAGLEDFRDVTEAEINGILSVNEEYQNLPEYSRQLVNSAATNYFSARREQQQEIVADMSISSLLTSAYGDTAQLEKNKDGYITYSVLNGQKREEYEISEIALRNLVATQNATQDLQNSISQLIVTLTQYANGTLAQQAISTIASTRSLESATFGQFTDLRVGFDADENNSITGQEVLDYLIQDAGGTQAALEQRASELGFTSGQAYYDAVWEAFVQGNEMWGDIASQGLEGIDSQLINSLTGENANRIISKVSELTLGPLGEQAGNSYVSGINTALEGVDEDLKTEALNSFLDIDWSSEDALEQMAENMSEFGAEIDTSSSYWQNFAERMQQADSYVPAFEDLKQNLQDVSTILGKLDFGSTISPEDYKTLVAYNDEWERFFILQADGSRKFIGDSQQMLETTRAQIRGQQIELNEQRTMAEQFSSGWRDVDWSNLTNKTTGDTYSYSSIVSGLMNGSDNTRAVLEQLGYSSDRLQEILTNLGDADEEVASAARKAVEQLASHINEFISYDFTENAQELMEMYASTATNYYELSRMLSEGIIDDAAYQKQSEYLLNTIASVEQLEDAYSAGYIASEQFQESINEVAERQAEQLGLEGDSISVQMQEMADKYKLATIYGESYEGVAARLALQNQLMNRGVSTLVQNWENWREELEATDTTTQDYADTVVDVTKVIKDLVGIVDDDFTLSSGFLKTAENIELLEQAAQGSEEAVERLGIAVAQDLVRNLEAVDFTSLSFDSEDQKNDFSKIFEGFEENKNIVLAGLEELQAQINDIGVGEDVTSILDDNWITALNEMAMATQMSVDDMNNMLNSIGVEADVVTVREPQKVEVPVYETITHVEDEGDPETGDGRVVRTTTNMVDTETMDGFVEVAQINTGEKVGSAPSSSRIIKTGNGGISSSAKGSGSSGGGGGKSGSQKKPKDPTGEIERYHVINNQIEDNEKALDRLSKAKDRAYGKAKLNAMDAEIAKQRESVELAERKLQEVEKYLELDSGAIAAFGAKFDANGTIVNYDQLMQEQIDKYNAAVDAYNNGPMDENAEAVFQQAEDDYNAFTEALKQYEETQDLWYEQAQAVADAKAEVLQLELEKTNYKVEIGIEWEEEDIARLDFMLKRIEDDAHKAAEAIGLLGERTVDAMDKYNVYQQGFADTLRNLGVGNAEDVIARASAGEDLYGMIGSIVDPNEMAQAVDQMDDYISNMMSSLEDAQDSVDQAFEKVKDLFNENVKQMDTYIEKIEFCQKITKSYMNIVDIVGKKSLGITNEVLRTFNAESVTQAVNNEAAAKAKMDSIQAQLMESQARLAQASGELEQKYWNEIIEEQEKELISATENFHQAWEDALQANLEAFENNIELVVEDFSDAVGDLNAMKAEWDLQKSLTDMWEPEYERWHQLSDLINDINKSVDENENLKYRQDLLDIETEIEQLQEQEAKLSEYDLNYLRLRYESKLAEIALEEAQAAKSQVRMSRDNEGNYSYIYTADEEAINNAADDYRNKIYEMEKANEEYIDTLQQQLLEMHDKMLEDIKEAGELYGVGTQAYYDAVARIQETYVGQSEFIQSQMQNVFTNNQRLRDEDIVQYIAYTGDVAAENVDLQTSFGDTYMGIQTQTDDLQTYFNDTWLPALNETFDNVILKAGEYSQQNEVAMETAGTTMDGFRDRASQDILEVTEKTTELAEETQNYGETAVDQFAQAARAWQTGPGALLDSINAQAQAIANLAQQYTSLKSQLDAAAESARQFAAAQSQARTGSAMSYVSSTSGSDSSFSGSPSGGGLGEGKGALIRSGMITPTVHSGDYYRWLESEDPNAELRRRGLLRFFDTGGYTGEWGNDGRLAILHQKELVLNAKDTANILTAVDVVRQLASSIDFNTMTAGLATASIKSASGNSGTVEQRVEITANFPNATDRNEIEQAFQNIVNMASQYAQRKND